MATSVLDKVFSGIRNLPTGNGKAAASDKCVRTDAQKKMDNNPECADTCIELNCGGKLVHANDGAYGCELCGVEYTRFGSTEEETRCFSADDQATNNAKKRTEEYGDSERNHLVCINHQEVGAVVSDASVDVVRSANNRLNQCAFWFRFLRNEEPGGFWLTDGEVMTARRAIRAACVQWAVDCYAATVDPAAVVDDAANGPGIFHIGSPVFWTIALTLHMVALRPNGYTMPTQKLCTLVSLDGLHAHLEKYKGEVKRTDESDLAKTQARGIAAAGQSSTEVVKRRSARWDALGDTTMRANKMNTLDAILKRSCVWKGNGLAPSVVRIENPALRAPPQSKRAQTEEFHVPVKRRCFGFTATKVRTYPSAPSVAPVRVPVPIDSAGFSDICDFTAASKKPTADADSENDSDFGESSDMDEDIWEKQVDDEPATTTGKKEKAEKVKKNYAPHQIKHLDWRQAWGSRNYELHKGAFIKEWTKERDAKTAREDARELKAANKVATVAAAVAAREARHEQNVITKGLKAAETSESKGFNQLMRQAAVQEKVEARGKGGCYVLPSDDMNPSSVQVVVVRQAPNIIKLSSQRSQEALAIIAAVPESDYQLKCCYCKTSRTLKGGVLRHQPNKPFRCTYINERCLKRK